jgi:SAM-dependent methyltransferase
VKKLPKLVGNRYRSKLGKYKIESPMRGNFSHCSCCGALDSFLISEIDREFYLNDTVVCVGCGLVFNDTFIANPEKFYSDSWASERWLNPELSFSKRTHIDAFAWRRFNFLVDAVDGFFNNKRVIIELGCGDGCNLYPFHLLGHRVLGLDYDERFFKPAQTCGMEMYNLNDMKSVMLPEADIVFLVHSLEHFKDLDAAILQVSRLLKDDGIVYVEVPGIRGFNKPHSECDEIMGVRSSNNFLGYLQFQHNFNFDMQHLLEFWNRNGFEAIYSDEFVRAIFRRSSPSRQRFSRENAHEIMEYIAHLEDDYNSVSNRARQAFRYIGKKFN